MSHIQIPPVTPGDLLKFQADHFFGANTSNIIPIGHHGVFQAQGVAEEALDEEAYYEGDGDLGYYKDGVKRTLTDEQIKIFRHSEIHALLRERQRLREEQEEEEDEGEYGAGRRFNGEKLHASISDSRAKSKTGSRSHPDSTGLAATRKRKSAEYNESRDVETNRKRSRDGIYEDSRSNMSPFNNDNETAENVEQNMSSRVFNSTKNGILSMRRTLYHQSLDVLHPGIHSISYIKLPLQGHGSWMTITIIFASGLSQKRFQRAFGRVMNTNHWAISVELHLEIGILFRINHPLRCSGYRVGSRKAQGRPVSGIHRHYKIDITQSSTPDSRVAILLVIWIGNI
ncbi:hypothetical protein UA08_08070 [Talaromyces atroroseus]|uniref:Uncharacterized protein n=1 Tax=Talaromyces atroroseus TaxID=1441469 RepID=A0A225APP3_TALAT|nr:hypothetical protein UA08_08070 [Talaromyces atroroseus]OKL56395.1 hypothetical protein UA08_08070 [Talaromyces atroroseus]